MTEPTMRKRKQREVIGWLVVAACCKDCRPPRGVEQITLEELREGDDAGNPYFCYRCGNRLGDAATQDSSSE